MEVYQPKQTLVVEKKSLQEFENVGHYILKINNNKKENSDACVPKIWWDGSEEG